MATIATIPDRTIHGDRARRDTAIAFALLMARWIELLRWVEKNGGLPAIPELRPQVEAWEAFKKQWQSRNDWWWVGAPGLVYALVKRDSAEDALSAAATDLAVAESNATRRGYAVPMMEITDSGVIAKADVPAATGASSPPMVRASARSPEVVIAPPATPDLETRHPIASAIDAAAPRLPDPRDPYLAPKAIGVGALALGTVLAAATAKHDTTRVGVAIVGTVATAGAAWLAFAPGAPSLMTKKAGA